MTAATLAPQTPQSGSRRALPRVARSRVLRHLLVPAALIAVLSLLYLYVSGQEPDRIEQRSLNSEYLLSRFWQHMSLTAAVVALILLIAIPLGVLLTRPRLRRYSGAVLAAANIGQATPSLGLIVLFAVVFLSWGIHTIAVVAFVAYGILPVLRNTMVGLDQVDRSIIESARGMGLTKGMVLRSIELPLAVPVMLAGIRTALVITVGTVALATFIGAGGLGDVISNGISSSRNLVLLTGSVLVAVLALTIDWLAGIVEDALRPRGV